MRIVSQEWQDNQALDLAPQALMKVDVEVGGTANWHFSNDEAAENLIEGTVNESVDHTRTSFPLASCEIVAENGVFQDEANTGYDFTDETTKALLAAGGTVAVNMGYRHFSGVDEVKPIHKMILQKVKVSSDDLYVTLSGISQMSKLDEATFYGGRYVHGGIDAYTLFQEIFDDVNFEGQGRWNYIIGDANCKVSNTQPLWEFVNTPAPYYELDNELANIMVHIPIPAVTHREALVMLAAYCGAYFFSWEDGQVLVALGSGVQLDYHIDENQVYERPEMTPGYTIARLRGATHAYRYDDDVTEITRAEIVAKPATSAVFRITHDGCHNGALELVGADIAGSPTYYTYSTVFTATPVGSSFTAILNGQAVQIGTNSFDLVYADRGEVREYDNPIASDYQRTHEMLDNYVAAEGKTRWTFTMRDDPAIEIGDRIFLDTVAVPTGIPVMVTEIKRTMNGGIDAEYTVVDDTHLVWYDDFMQTNMVEG